MALGTAGRVYFCARCSVGVVFLLAPTVAERSWTGIGVSTGGVVPLRAMGARDVALSIGVLAADRNGADTAPWLWAAAVAEAADAVAVLAVGRLVPRTRRALASGGPAVLAVAGAALALRRRPGQGRTTGVRPTGALRRCRATAGPPWAGK